MDWNKLAENFQEKYLGEARNEQIQRIATEELIGAVKEVLEKENISAPDNVINTIAWEWLRATVESGYVEETLYDDLWENDVMRGILAKIDPGYYD